MITPRRIAASLYAVRATDELIPWFPVYAIYMIESGISTTQLASLFVIWSITAFGLEIPSGAWADTFSRRKLVAFGTTLRAAGFLIWLIWPSYWGFALGFVLWSIRSAIKSGAVEALVYDELAAIGDSDSYLRVISRGQTVALVSVMVAVGPLAGRPVLAMVLLAGSFGAMQLMRLLAETKLQTVIEGSARATVFSVAGVGTELCAVAVYFGCGLGSYWWSASTVVALFAFPLLAVAVLTRFWLPAKESAAQPVS